MDLPARARAYACHITYCTNKELVFDYLRTGSPRRARSQRSCACAARWAARRGPGCCCAACTSPSSTRPTAS
jgi:hypothetical protein